MNESTAVSEPPGRARIERADEARNDSQAGLQQEKTTQRARGIDFRAPNWLQAFLIFAIFGAALFVAVNEHYLWAGILTVAGVAFGASYVLRRMVGDEYDRT